MTEEVKCLACGKFFSVSGSTDLERMDSLQHECDGRYIIVPPDQSIPYDKNELNEIWKLEDRLSKEGKHTAYIFDKVSLHGDYTAEDLTEILKYLIEKE